jgi:epoxyqueuosine reductase
MDESESTISYYARGRDYHRVLKKRAMALCDRLHQITPSFEGRIFVDTAPVAERDLAYASGLGWIGKNGMLIVPGAGNSVLLAEIICNLPLRPGKPLRPQCGDCSQCIEACPTGAIVADRTVDSRLCLSYHTIENRGTIPAELRENITTTVFGCDRCHDACPYSRCGPSGDADLAPLAETQPTINEILQWNESDWDKQTRGRATRRATLEMFRRNAAICAGNSGDLSMADSLRRLSQQPGSCEEIDWAMDRLDRKRDGGYKDAHE